VSPPPIAANIARIANSMPKNMQATCGMRIQSGTSPLNRAMAGCAGKAACSAPRVSCTRYSSFPAIGISDAGSGGNTAPSVSPVRTSGSACHGSLVGYFRHSTTPATAASATVIVTGMRDVIELVRSNVTATAWPPSCTSPRAGYVGPVRRW